MALKICRICQYTCLVPGPRNQKVLGYCRFHGLMALAEADMLAGWDEGDELLGMLMAGRRP